MSLEGCCTKKNPLQNSSFKEDSIIYKGFTCVPIIGPLFNIINESSLAQKISTSNHASHLIKLIEVKNHYKISSIIRDIITIAIIATFIALKILSGTVGFIIGGMCIAVLVAILSLNIYRIHHNNTMISVLNKGFQPNLKVK